MASAVRATVNTSATTTSTKRKRGPGDTDGRAVKTQNVSADQDNQFASLLQGIDGAITGADESTRTAQAALAAPMGGSAYPEPNNAYGPASGMQPFDENVTGGPSSLSVTDQALFDDTDGPPTESKPVVGSTAWHQQRKDNHKEVERRRREVINEGIENIAKIVPGNEKNKGAILQRTCTYIAELQQKVAGFEKERATVDVALKELTSRVDRFKENARQAWQDSSKWQQRCRDAGLQFDDYDDGLQGFDEDDVTAGLS